MKSLHKASLLIRYIVLLYTPLHVMYLVLDVP